MASTQKDREEIRTMLHEVIDPWQTVIDRNDRATNIALNNIDRRLDNLNSKVAKHEEVINKYLPPTASNCPNAAIIKTLETESSSDAKLKRFLFAAVTIIAGLLSSAWLVVKLFFDNTNGGAG